MTNTQTLPADLRETGLFCCWRYEERNGRQTKVPYNPRTGGKAQTDNPATFAPLAEAQAAQESYDGLGVGIFGGLAAIDIDHCINGYEWSELAKDIYETMDCYTETSPSGEGLRLLFSVAPGFQYDKSRYYINRHELGLEVYVAGCTNKYVTVTGSALNDCQRLQPRDSQLMTVLEKYMVRPQPDSGALPRNEETGGQTLDLSDGELLEKARSAKNGAAFSRLWDGDAGAYQSQSEADLALCNQLAFWTGRDPDRMDRLFRQSGLMRNKWDRRQSGTTYGAITIQNACRSCREVYTPRETAQQAFQPVGNGGFGGFGIAPQTEHGFCEFCAFCGPDLSKNPVFPVEELSDILRNMTVGISDSLQVAADMPAVSLLTVVSLCAQKKFMVNPKPGWLEPVNLYSAVVALPSERKSPMAAEVMSPIYSYMKRENDSRRPAVEEYRTRKDMLQRRIESMKKMATSGKRAKNDSPATTEDIMALCRELDDLEQREINYLNLVADDITMEALATAMVENGGKMALVSTEGGIFNTLSGLYSNGVVNMDLFLKSYSGDFFQIDRVSRKRETIEHPSLTVLLTVQRSVLEAIMGNNDFKGRGLLARFLYSIPVSTVGKRRYDTGAVPEEFKGPYCELIDQLLSLPDDLNIIRFTREAQEEAKRLFEDLEPRLREDLEPLGDWAGKHHGRVMRIAALLHICDHGAGAANIPLPGETIRRARKIGDYFITHAKTAYQIMGMSETQEVKDAKYILKRLDSTGEMEISKKRLFDLCRRAGIETVEQMEPGLRVLVQRGYVKVEKATAPQNPQNTQNPQKGGRPSWMICVNPQYTEWKEAQR